jgi:phospholipase C
MQNTISRRELLRAGAAGGAAVGAWSLFSNRLVEKALAYSDGGCASLSDVEHIVILIQENRSFDHYFGTYKGVAGFQDPNAISGVFGQAAPTSVSPSGVLYPFRLNTDHGGECTNDIDHSWGPQHAYWDGGAMDRWVSEHVSVDGPQNGPLTMGYYTRQDLPFYYALADAFTICDQYHCSVIGPTDPNRCYTMSASIDPDGQNGGPIVSTLESTRIQTYGKFTWKTMPEVLQAAGVTWKVYESPENLSPVSDNVLPYFAPYVPQGGTAFNPQLAANAFGNSYWQFLSDAAAGTLPQVSWVIAPVVQSEHPPSPVTYGEVVTAQVLNALLSNQAVWESSALLVTYDENGGFFDHVNPPTAPAGTSGEFVTTGVVPATDPIGLGFRVPMLVVSPFSKGGFVYSGTLDHTSTLRLLETRFGTPVPNLTAWRRATVGDMTGAFNFARVDTSSPTLPAPSAADMRVVGWESCQTALISAANESSAPTHYPIDTSNTAPPPQEPGTATAPSGPVACSA